MKAANFADRLIAQIERKKSCVVVGLDPRVEMLPPSILERASIPGDECESAARAIMAFNRRIIEIVAPHACAVKPQAAFYELYGWEGMRAYAETISYAHEAGLLVIGDVKRGDIGATAEAYAEAHLMRFGADAVTINPYMGTDSVKPFLDLAAREGKGVFALVKTSNPSSGELQDLDVAGKPLYLRVTSLIAKWDEGLTGTRGYSALGAVVGATYPREAAAIREMIPRSFLLLPGYGAQGARAADCKPCFNPDGLGAVVNSSRGIIFAWTLSPWRERFGQERWEKAVEAAVVQMKEELAEIVK